MEHCSPRSAQQYLCKLWACFRAWAARQEINYFGFRVAEPHHDGTPHWHLLLFVRADQASEFEHRMRAYALAKDGQEAGAAKYRFSSVAIKTGVNPKTGKPYSAAAYIAKYIAKNLDAVGVDLDYETGSPAEGSLDRVTAWARRNGIRQFQQFGGPRVSVWRELRRLSQGLVRGLVNCSNVPEVEALVKKLANQANIDAAEAWALFCSDPVARKLKLEYRTRTTVFTIEPVGSNAASGSRAFVDQFTGEIIPANGRMLCRNFCGDPINYIYGLSYGAQSVKTRFYTWTLRHDSKSKALTPPLASLSLFSLSSSLSALARPWKIINNCTEEKKPDYEHNSYAIKKGKFSGRHARQWPTAFAASSAEPSALSDDGGKVTNLAGHGFCRQGAARGEHGDAVGLHVGAGGRLSGLYP